MKQRILFLCWVLIGTVCRAAPEVWSEQDLLQGTLAAVRGRQQSTQIKRLSSRLSQRLTESSRFRSQELSDIEVLVDCVRYMQWTQQAIPSEAVNQWLLADKTRLNLLVDTILPEDNLKYFWFHLDKLLQHDPSGAEKHLKLMLALSVVWDTPKRPPMHHHQHHHRQIPDSQYAHTRRKGPTTERPPLAAPT